MPSSPVEPAGREHARSWPTLLTTLLTGSALSADDTAWAMGEIMSGEATPAQVAGFAVALRAKGETAEEIAGLVRTMLDRATPVAVFGRAVDVVGTGGDRAHTVNISTMAAMVAAAAGARVVKHGNRAASSSCGAADLLEALGVVIELDGEGVTRCVDTTGIGFCFAPVFHPALRHTAAARRELGVPTVFNFLGPLTNPARPAAAAVGCADARMAPLMANVLAARGGDALVFRGDDGLDELTTTTTTRAWAVTKGAVTVSTVDASALGLPPSTVDDLRGGTATQNAKVARAVLGGQTGPVRDAVILNAAAALAVFDGLGAVGSLEDALRAGMSRATTAIDDGAVTRLLDRWVAASRAA
ncbi:MAG: anthranilate phosphoribosyltransferase [Mycobacteriales bacterium]|nr:MAG: anthranilate phosphoribosyltransferase [Pseudonocardiales bacterium]